MSKEGLCSKLVISKILIKSYIGKCIKLRSKKKSRLFVTHKIWMPGLIFTSGVSEFNVIVFVCTHPEEWKEDEGVRPAVS